MDLKCTLNHRVPHLLDSNHTCNMIRRGQQIKCQQSVTMATNQAAIFICRQMMLIISWLNFGRTIKTEPSSLMFSSGPHPLWWGGGRREGASWGDEGRWTEESKHQVKLEGYRKYGNVLAVLQNKSMDVSALLSSFCWCSYSIHSDAELTTLYAVFLTDNRFLSTSFAPGSKRI